MNKFKNIINRFPKKKLLVIGDLILDRYIQGSVSRISPEAPVPVVLESRSFYTPGGASNVAKNLSALGATVIQVGKIGNDFEGQLLKRQLKKERINTAGVFLDKNLPTVTKTRVIAQHQQVVRIDKEKLRENGDTVVNEKIIAFIRKSIAEVDAIILSDYGKGMLSQELTNMTCKLALSKGKIITVDPKIEHFNFYRKVTAITPNLKEAENAIRNIKITSFSTKSLSINFDKLETDRQIDAAGNELLAYLDLESLLITMGERGMRLFEKDRKKPVMINTTARDVFDVTGAGDTVISVFTLALAAGATKKQAAQLANAAAGIVVGKMGAVAVTRDELRKALKDII